MVKETIEAKSGSGRRKKGERVIDDVSTCWFQVSPTTTTVIFRLSQLKPRVRSRDETKEEDKYILSNDKKEIEVRMDGRNDGRAYGWMGVLLLRWKPLSSVSVSAS